MQTDVIQRRAPRPLDGTTNGHAPGANQITSSDYPSSSDEDEDVQERTSNRHQADRSRLRHATPLQLLEAEKQATEKRLFFCLLLFRCFVAVITSRTLFAPDEHWQSLEVAHRMIFGYGYETWEWRDPRVQIGNNGWGSGPIRSPLYPALFMPTYWLLQKLFLDNTPLLTLLPSLVQAFLAALTDLFTFKLAHRLLNERAAWITLVPTIVSLYTFHTSTRTLSNSAESAFTIMAFYYWPLSIPETSDNDQVAEVPLIHAGSLQVSLVFFALSTILRPSNVLLSLPLVIILMKRILRNVKSAGTALESAFAFIIVGRTCLMVGFLAASLLTLVDSLYYGRLTFTPIGFLKRNVLESISLFYGQSPLHFYISSALPFICLTTLPYTLHGFFISLQENPLAGFNSTTRRWYGIRGERDPGGLKTMAQVTLLFIASMSVLGHKEVRFLQPIVPLLHILEGYALSSLPSLTTIWNESREVLQEQVDDIRRTAYYDRSHETEFLESLSSHSTFRNRRQLLSTIPRLSSQLKRAIGDIIHRHGRLSVILLGLHILPTIYLCFHSAGQISVVEAVGNLSRQGQLDQVAFLMPCHSTPWMSHMHDRRLSRNNNSWFVSCEPPLAGQELATYKDESDYFYDDPYSFIQQRFSSKTSPWPSHMALFEALLSSPGPNTSNVSTLLADQGYVERYSFWNSIYHLDHRRRGRILLLERMKAAVQKI